MMIILRERERERNSSSGNKCPKCGKLANSRGKCYTRSCVNYWKSDKPSNSPSKFKRGNCPECGRSNVIINPESGLCNDCGMRQLRLMIQELIKAEGLKSAQIEWESMKSYVEEIVRLLRQNGEEEAARMVESNIQTIEKDLYPNKGGSSWIWILVIGIIVVVGLVSFVWWKSKRKKNNF